MLTWGHQDGWDWCLSDSLEWERECSLLPINPEATPSPHSQAEAYGVMPTQETACGYTKPLKGSMEVQPFFWPQMRRKPLKTIAFPLKSKSRGWRKNWLLWQKVRVQETDGFLLHLSNLLYFSLSPTFTKLTGYVINVKGTSTVKRGFRQRSQSLCGGVLKSLRYHYRMVKACFRPFTV